MKIRIKTFSNTNLQGIEKMLNRFVELFPNAEIIGISMTGHYTLYVFYRMVEK